MMTQELYLELGEILLKSLGSKFNFNMTNEERWNLTEYALGEIARGTNDARFKKIYDDHLKRKEFIERFLAYDEVDEFIHDSGVEDIDINSTNPIFIHRTDKGFMKTNKSFNSARYLDFFKRKLIIFSGRVYLRKINDYEIGRASCREKCRSRWSPYH